MRRRVSVTSLVAVVMTASMTVVWGQYPSVPTSESAAPIRKSDTEVVPSRSAEFFSVAPPPGAVAAENPQAWGRDARRIDGTTNNLAHPDWGAVGCHLLRKEPCAYADNVSIPSGGDRPNPRQISRIVVAQPGNLTNAVGATDWMWQWGQFLDHDLDMVPVPADLMPFPIPVPMGDPFFDPNSTGTQLMDFDRSAYDYSTATGPDNPREQFNLITGFIDASMVYGSDDGRALWLRTMDGTGKLKTSPGDMPPYNTIGLPNGGGTSPTLFITGDMRTNEQLGLIAIHTLFVREHNYLADQFRNMEPGLSDEEIYQRARAIVGAEIQVISYKEFLPVLLGSDAIPPYKGYDETVDPSISSIFATACYRIGHTMLSSHILRMDRELKSIPQGAIPLREAFFVPTRLVNEGGVEPIYRGLATQLMQDIDPFIVEEVQNFLFGSPGQGGLDLASLNIQRGRDHGLPSYNAARIAFGLPAAANFYQVSSNPVISGRLQLAYGDVNKIDIWVGALAEDKVPGALVGSLMKAVLVDQFTRVRDGDRFWYQNQFSGTLLVALENTRLSDVIRRNTTIRGELQNDVFHIASAEGPPVPAASAGAWRS